jgi:hypothetical protein
MADQCNENLEGMTGIRKMECSYTIESEFLSSMIILAQKQAGCAGFDGKEINDVADQEYKNNTSFSQAFGKGDKINLLDIKKRIFVWNFIEIKKPILVDQSSQISADAQYNQYLVKRQNKIDELKVSINKSSLLTKVFCVYLARSNYPKKNAFEILPSELEQFFDSERKNSKHLKGAKILDSILVLKKFNL